MACVTLALARRCLSFRPQSAGGRCRGHGARHLAQGRCCGALAVGALAVGALAIGRLEIRKARLRKVPIRSGFTVRRFLMSSRRPESERRVLGSREGGSTLRIAALRGPHARRALARGWLLPSDAAACAPGLGPISVGRLDRAGRALRLFGSVGRSMNVRGNLSCSGCWPISCAGTARGFALTSPPRCCSPRAPDVVGARLSGQCRARQMGERPGAGQLGRVSRAVGMGACGERRVQFSGFAALIWSVLVKKAKQRSSAVAGVQTPRCHATFANPFQSPGARPTHDPMPGEIGRGAC